MSDASETPDIGAPTVGSRPPLAEPGDTHALVGRSDAAPRTKAQPWHNRPAERAREAAMRAGWNGDPWSGWWAERGAQDGTVHAAFARGLERRRIAMELGVWYPGRDRRAALGARIEERQAARRAIGGVLDARRRERERLEALQSPPVPPARDGET